MALDYPLINGFRHSFANISAAISTDTAVYICRGITELNYSEEVSPGVVRGNRPQKIGETIGTYEASGSMTMLKEDFEEFIGMLSPEGASLGYMAKRFTLTVTFADPSRPAITNTHVLNGVRIKKVQDDGSEGEEALTVQCDLSLQEVIRDGKTAMGTAWSRK